MAALYLLSISACRTVSTTVDASVPSTSSSASAPAQLAQQNVDATIYQNMSAEVHRLYQQGYELAKIRLDANLARPHTKPPAVIVDIDETVLDNSPYQVTNAANGRTYSPETWKQWTAKASAKALPGAVEFLNYAASRGCEVFYISNREADEEAATVRNLATVGFPMADTLHVVPMVGTSDKTARRAAVAKTHYIALLAGDQLRDFDESFKNRSVDNGKPLVDAQRDTLERYFIMLPNSMYGTWLDAVSGKPLESKPANKEAVLKKNAY
ncbi:MAG: 5'-nucleotidase, lipoprotein e(P4) family [Bacteroidetes bacterium]|nr:5'-nucleotidase, lipoprotein e(P4) family [Bacteroidota bacterium]